MKKEFDMKTMRHILTVGLLTASAVGAAQARGVNWSVGVNVPGVAIGVGAPAYYAPYPSYYGGYYAPAYGAYYGYANYAPAYVAPPVYYAPPVVYPARAYYGRPAYRTRVYRGVRR
jgi:hypothetical protein